MRKFVEVLCLNGRRQKIKAPPNQTILQILKEACKKQGYNDAEIDLMHKRKLLDVTLTVSHANIPNNGKLEMVKRNIPRKAMQVEIALQTELYERLQHSFNSSCSLYDVLKHWNDLPDRPYSGKIIMKTPVMVYMTRQITGVQNLKSTTLEHLGLIAGKAAIRLIYKDEEDIGMLENSMSTMDVVPVNSSQSNKQNIASNVATKAVEENKESVCSAASCEVSENRDIDDLSADETSKMMGGSASDHTEFEEPKHKKQKSAEISTASAVENIPVSHTQITNMHRFPFKEFKFPDKAEKDFELDGNIKAIEPKEIKMEIIMSMPCARNPIVFNLNQEETFEGSTEPSEDFFEVTIDDLRKLVIEKKRSLEDEPLTTKFLKEAKEKERISQYKKVVIRVQFPGRIALQGVFRPLEKISALKEFVRDYLEDSCTEFDLYTTPPKCILKDLSKTLHSAKLIPAAVVHISSRKSTEKLLKQEFIDSAVSYKEAELAAFHIMKRYSVQNSTQGLSPSSADEPTSTNHRAVQQVSQRTPSTSNESQQTVNKTGKAPKWFQSGKR